MITKPNVRTLLLFLTIIPAVFVSLNATVYYSGNDIYPLCSTSKVFVSGYVTGAFDRASLDQSTLITYSMEVYDVSVSQARAEKNGIALREEYAKIRGYTLSELVGICMPPASTDIDLGCGGTYQVTIA